MLKHKGSNLLLDGRNKNVKGMKTGIIFPDHIGKTFPDSLSK